MKHARCLKRALRAMPAVLALALAAFGLTGCGDTDDDCDASPTQAVRYEAAAFDARIDGTTGGRGGGSKGSAHRGSRSNPKSGKTVGGTTGGTLHNHDHDCEDND